MIDLLHFSRNAARDIDATETTRNTASPSVLAGFLFVSVGVVVVMNRVAQTLGRTEQVQELAPSDSTIQYQIRRLEQISILFFQLPDRMEESLSLVLGQKLDAQEPGLGNGDITERPHSGRSDLANILAVIAERLEGAFDQSSGIISSLDL